MEYQHLYRTEGDEPKTVYAEEMGKLDRISVMPFRIFGSAHSKKGITIRGELINDERKRLKKIGRDKFGNARNMIAGTANAKSKFIRNDGLDIDFVAYEVIQPELSSK